MSDAPRFDGSRARDGAPEADRDGKIEQLLLDGLDHYFAARYADAIHVWTRALFLDRNHPRARAYIERARSALAERQRQAEQLLHDGLSAFQRGDGESARRLLQEAISSGAPQDEALAVLGRLDRLDQPRAAIPVPGERRKVARPAQTALRVAPDRGLGMWLAVLLTIVVVAIVIAVFGHRIGGSLFEGEPAPSGQVAPVVSRAPLSVPRRGEMALARARTLAASGHLRDALGVLAAVRATDPEKGAADRLRADLQQQLRGTVAPGPPPAAKDGLLQP